MSDAKKETATILTKQRPSLDALSSRCLVALMISFPFALFGSTKPIPPTTFQACRAVVSLLLWLISTTVVLSKEEWYALEKQAKVCLGNSLFLANTGSEVVNQDVLPKIKRQNYPLIRDW